MSLLHAIILGIVEGITEFLPISSTGHMVLVSSLLKIPETDFVKSFEIIIQFGAILAVLLISGQRLLALSKGLKQVLIAFLPTAAIGFVLYKVIKHVLMGNPLITVAALIIGGIVIIALEDYFKRKEGKKNIQDLIPAHSVVIGICQALAVIPGVSRSATTIYSGMMTGLTRQEAVEFSFLLAVPTIAAASGYDLVKSGAQFSSGDFVTLGVGFIVAFITAYITIHWFLGFVRKNTLTGFGIYRIIVGIAYLLIVR
jgi:undecaprenyl-diphosphatase